MTPLRKKMIAAMRQRDYSVRTHQAYLYAVTQLAKHFKRSPDELDVGQLQAYFNHLVQQRDLSGESCRQYLNAIRFLYLQVLQWPAFDVRIIIPKHKQRIPELLTRAEVAALFDACHNLKHRTLLCTCYGCGLRVSELVSLKVRHIDGERRVLRVEQGKGAKDRLVMAPAGLLQALRLYWQYYHPTVWLFPNNRDPHQPLNVQTPQRMYTKAKRQGGIHKIGGIHALRHAYATHQLEAGMPVHILQRQLGHRDIKSTLRYVHWVPNYRGACDVCADLITELGHDNAPAH